MRTAAAHPFDADEDHLRIDFFQLRPIESPLFQNAQAEVFDEHIGFLYQLSHELAPFRGLHIDREGLLTPLELHEVGFFVPKLRILAAVTVAAQARLAADHLGAELAEHPRHGWARCAGREFDDSNSL
jgi:hypothetical protein